MHITMRVLFIVNVLCIIFILAVQSAPQQGLEVDNQFEESNHTEVESNNTKPAEANWIMENGKESVSYVNKTINSQTNDTALKAKNAQVVVEGPGLISEFYITFKTPIIKFIQTPKVSIVLKNIGTCIVNGAMEIVSYYFPAPLIPLIASAAGMIIPFEPIVMLRNRMPVTSYRRAFNSAMNSFVGTFDRFKTSEEDPYMTRRFNRRFMEGNSKANKDTNT